MPRKAQIRFGVIAGSVARGTENAQSDLDYVRIGPARKIPINLPTGGINKISAIRYDWAKFNKLYKEGSLFVYHLFSEGVLIEGNQEKWSALKSGFKVRKKFTNEIKRYKSALRHIVNSANEHISVIPFLAHTLRCLKNIAIFSLAEEGVYVFEKAGALKAFFPTLPNHYIEIMLMAESILDRNETTKKRSDWMEFNACSKGILKICQEILSKK